MKRAIYVNAGLILVVGMFVFGTPLVTPVQFSLAAEGAPSIEQILVREGTFAVELAKTFGLSENINEVEAESWLAEKGILPLNGWIADYPVTPDIIGELRKSVSSAGETGKINVNKVEAVNRFDKILAVLKLDIMPLNDGQYARVIENNEDSIPADQIDSYYLDQGPPVVTYYAPPPDYYGMYSWISYPFWCDGFWYGGYFILNDFNRPVFFGRDHHRGFVSNHFRDRNHDHFTRIDPQTRAAGSNATGIGISVGRSLTPAGSRQNSNSGMTPIHASEPPAIRSTTVNAGFNHPSSQEAPVTRAMSFSTPDRKNALRGGDRKMNPSWGGNVSQDGSYVSVRSDISRQSSISQPYRSFAAPVQRTETPVSIFSAPRTNSTVRSFTTPTIGSTPQVNFSRSFNSGYTGGSSSRGYSSGFSAGHSTGFSGGHGRR